MPKELKLPAIEVKQSQGKTLYTFAVDGKLVPQFATISRVRRKDDGVLSGYQRPEVLSHIDEIRTYLESNSPMVPNALVVAFDSRVKFLPDSKAVTSDYSRAGVLTIPFEAEMADDRKPGFIVDGQQRLAAIRDANIERFPICMTAFITDDVGQQTEQFILVNSTKPLPKGLIYELLPGTTARLPSLLDRRRLPAQLLERMNLEEGSPLQKMIQTATNPHGLIKDNSILRMLENSLNDGVLYRFNSGDEATADIEQMLNALYAYWAAVSEVFKAAWGLPPKKSRLMHGAGIISMGLIMDAISDRYRERKHPTAAQFATDLVGLKEFCRWTAGFWDFGPGQQRKWNEVQNTSKDIELLTNYLMIQYKSKVWSAPSPASRTHAEDLSGPRKKSRGIKR
ncbi:DGQHR domain-containing protein DpdB [Corallococcus sp. bb12-1]|uniref:DGQHR domain-containing protein DpdB n=1 Tax=Corallococcus sp. bb12-1 TaxID=2996784 RepID=UPI00226F7E7A|nr:DGQHR domain-containing protein DpdB [Corallococcus sp. bb12-1]MCY1046708.1 DGQHR domain-containing protein DpdB [Corallococcus sp. bb12-1]